MSDPQPTGYYGRPVIRPPEWTALIPIYFFAGGFAGAAATIACAERLSGNERLARTMLLGAAGSAGVSAFCLIADLKRPERFLNMLRVFKPTSPMSVGVYIFSAFGGAVSVAAASEITGIAPRLGNVAAAAAAVIGPMMSVYTGVLIGDTVVPAWYGARKTLPVLFAATSAASAGGYGLLLCRADAAGTARRLALLGGLAVPIALARLETEAGDVTRRAYKDGRAGRLAKAARLLTTAGTAAAALSRFRPSLGRAAGAMLLGASLLERFAIFEAGAASARDPRYVVENQRRLE